MSHFSDNNADSNVWYACIDDVFKVSSQIFSQRIFLSTKMLNCGQAVQCTCNVRAMYVQCTCNVRAMYVQS